MIRTAIIAHGESELNMKVLPKWLGEFTDLAGIVEIREPGKMKFRRLKYEYRKSGFFGVIDSLLFRLYHRLVFQKDLDRYKNGILKAFEKRPGPSGENIPRVVVANPNEKAVGDFLRELQPDLVIVRCKYILKKRIFEVPRLGCFIMHPGICPEYRNSHGCFWAMVNEDYDQVGMTLLKIDAGIDTGPIYGYFKTSYSKSESPLLIQDRVVYDNLDKIKDRLIEIAENRAEVHQVEEKRKSGLWGQPHLSAYLTWRLRIKDQ